MAREDSPLYGGLDPDDPHTHGRRIRVLLVDDNVVVIRLLEKMLADGDVEVQSSTSALSAVERVGREAFDVMFVDLRMKPIGGLEVLRRTEGLVPRRYVLTGYADAAEIAEALSLGATAVLHKPLDKEEMLALIHSDS